MGKREQNIFNYRTGDSVFAYRLNMTIAVDWIIKLEDLKVLRRSPGLLNNVKIGQGLLQLIMEQILFYHTWGL